MKYLIAIDGLDGCGKDTHLLRIKKTLEERGDEIVVFRHPSNRLIGRMSKRAVQGSGVVAMVLATVFYTIDVLISVRKYKRTHGGTVIFVRYLLGTAYLPAKMAHPAYTLFRKILPFPDLPLFIDIDPAVAIRRIEIRDQAREMFETVPRLTRIREIAHSVAAGEWIVVDNSEDGEAPFARMNDILISNKFA